MSQSDSDYDDWEDSIGPHSVYSVSTISLSTVSSCEICPTSDDPFAEHVPHYLSEMSVASNNHGNGPPAVSSHVASNEISRANEMCVNIFDVVPLHNA